jgi:hypothetical protein
MWEEGCASGLAKYNRRQELGYDDLFLEMGVVLCFNTMSIALRQKLKSARAVVGVTFNDAVILGQLRLPHGKYLRNSLCFSEDSDL